MMINQLYEYLINNNLLTDSQLASDLCFPLKQLYLRLRLNGYGIIIIIIIIILYLTTCHLGAKSSFKRERETNYKY